MKKQITSKKKIRKKQKNLKSLLHTQVFVKRNNNTTMKRKIYEWEDFAPDGDTIYCVFCKNITRVKEPKY